MNSPQLDRELRNELQARLDLQLKALPDLLDEEKLAVALWMADHLKEVLGVIEGDAGHMDTRSSANEAAEYLPDLVGILQMARADWLQDPQGMEAQIDREKYAADRETAKESQR